MNPALRNACLQVPQLKQSLGAAPGGRGHEGSSGTQLPGMRNCCVLLTASPACSAFANSLTCHVSAAAQVRLP